MLIEFLGHAGIQLSAGSTIIAMDVWMSERGAFDASWFQYPCNHDLIDREWAALDAYAISHEHMDHLDPEVVGRLSLQTPILVPDYGTEILPRKVQRLTGRAATSVMPALVTQVKDVELCIWVESSPMNEDSVWAFRSPEGSVVHLVDSRVNLAQIKEILDFCQGAPDLLLVQCSGASWYPFCYQNYGASEKREKSIEKRMQKWSYAKHVIQELNPAATAVVAGPPVFLDPNIREANLDPSFPTPGESREWLSSQGCEGVLLAPLPGDEWDIKNQVWSKRSSLASTFSWSESANYVENYAARMGPTIARTYREAELIESNDLFGDFRRHFEEMLVLNEYFLGRIDMNVVFEIVDLEDACWLVEFRTGGCVRKYDEADNYGYRYSVNSRWLKRILVEKQPWEDFFLSLRFDCMRSPDQYSDHLLGLMKFNDQRALAKVEAFERLSSSETLEVVDELGRRFLIQKYCPHAGASLEKSPIEGGQITCLLHHYVFDLETGESLTGDCHLATKRIG